MLLVVCGDVNRCNKQWASFLWYECMKGVPARSSSLAPGSCATLLQDCSHHLSVGRYTPTSILYKQSHCRHCSTADTWSSVATAEVLNGSSSRAQFEQYSTKKILNKSCCTTKLVDKVRNLRAHSQAHFVRICVSCGARCWRSATSESTAPCPHSTHCAQGPSKSKYFSTKLEQNTRIPQLKDWSE